MSTRNHWLSLLGPVLLFCILRLPALIHQHGGEDEQFFSVPGWTVWREGIPRIPYLPTRNRETFLENADRCLMALPPAQFYVQAVFFAIFPPGYPTSRLPAFVGSLAIILLAYFLARRLGVSHGIAWLVAGLLTCTRQLMFVGISARPDALCILCGLAAVAFLICSDAWHRAWLPLTVGGLCGLAGLFPPLALVFGIQAGIAMLIAPGSLALRLRRVGLLAFSAVGVVSLWIPLIWRFPNEFRSQFFSNVLNRAGPGLHMRLLWPFPSLSHHVEQLWEIAGPWQFSMLFTILLVSTLVFLCSPTSLAFRKVLALCWSAVYLTATVSGIHPLLGYWLFSTTLILVLLGVVMQHFEMRSSRLLVIGIVGMVLTLFGSGLRSSWTYLRHFGSSQYHAGCFIKGLLAELPREGLFLADTSYVFDVYLSGRTTLYCAERQLYWGDQKIPFDYLLIASEGMDARVAEQYGAEQVRLVGSRSQPQTCFVYIYAQQDPP